MLNNKKKIPLKKVLKIVAKLLGGIFINIVYFLSGFLPKDNDLWLFGAWEGLRYCDNAKYLFEYLASNPDILPKRIVWITHSQDVRDALRDKNLPVFISTSWKAWYYCLKAGFIFVTHGRHDVINFLTRRAVVVNLNHALPIKHMGYDATNLIYYKPPSRLHKIFFKVAMPYWTIKFDYSVSASKQTSHIFSSFQKINKDRILPFGFPRFQHLLYEKQSKNAKLRWLEQISGKTDALRYVILYIPTFRDKGRFNHFGYNFDLKALETLLAKYQAILLISLHPFDNSPVPPEIAENKNEYVKNIKIENINDSLGFVDILITDYSSVMFDYLLLGRPIIYTQFDFSEFIKEQRGLYFYYDEVTPGYKARNWQEVINSMADIFSLGYDKYADEKKKLRNALFNSDYRDVNKKIVEYFAA